VKNVSCFGGNDGKVIITVNGGQSPFKYSLNSASSQATNEFNNLVGGAYKATVTDANNFSNTIKFTIAEPAKLATTIKTDSTTVNIIIKGGTSPYQIDYDKKGFAKDTNFVNQTNGWHYYTIKDANGCETKDSFALKTNTLNVLFDLKKPSCFGAADATLTVDTKGGKAPFSYALNNDALQTKNTFTNLAAGVYKITVRDADSLTRSLNISIVAPDVLSATAKTQRDSIVLTAKGGTAPYQYSIDNAANFQKDNVFTKIANGAYSFIVKDANGCTKNIANYQFTTTREQANVLGITFMPNPVRDVLQIAFKIALESDTNLRLFNSQGQVVAEDKISSQSNLFLLRLHYLPQGLYYIVLRNQQFETNDKIMIGF
jgi:large repetitive protein